MDATSARWRQITPSQFQWEAEALDYLRAHLPDADPIQSWANFEFVSGGSLNEVDLLITTRKGFWLIEIKSHPGKITGGQSLWTWHRPDGSKSTFDNPIFLANLKAKRLKGLLQHKWADKDRAKVGPVPFVKVLVFLSAPDVDVSLSPDLAAHVCLRQPDHMAIASGTTPNAHFRGVIDTIHTIGEAEAANSRFKQFSSAEADAVTRAMSMVGIKQSTKSRRVGSYQLILPALAERGSTQDFLAKHEQHGTLRRVRIYSNVVGMSPEQASTLNDAATREYLATERLHIDGVIRALDQPQTDLGPAVIYDHHPDAVRLDRFLAERGDELDLLARLRIVRRIADILRQVHGRRITHRMLTPQSIWLRPARSGESHADHDSPADHGDHRDHRDHGERWIPEISDLSMAARETTGGSLNLSTSFSTSRFAKLPTVGSGDLEVVLADPSVEPFLAPESYTDPDPDGQALDVFSVGVIAYLLCADAAPATTRAEMREALGATGLRVSARVPEIDPSIDDLVREATCPVVSERFPRMSDVVAATELAIGAIGTADRRTDPADNGDNDHSLTPAETDPLDAKEGDVLGDRFIVKRRLGKGSTARALLCADTDTDRDVVIKASLGGSADDRLRSEAIVLHGLRQPQVVELYEVVELAGRPALVEAFAGDRSLALSIRLDGPASPEFLQRWGTDLLEAVRFLEREGRSHRDIKPDNLGIVAQGKNNERHLVLFDFSMAVAPNSDLTAGTPGYLEPFLDDRKPKAWDLWAERYAVAVTLHELATGEMPRWGDGRSNPLYTEGECTIALEALDPELRVPLGGFFAKALRRDHTQRFDTAEDMLRAWQRAFEGLELEADEPAGATTAIDARGTETRGTQIRGTDRSERSTLDGTRGRREAVPLLPAQLALDDPIVSLGVRGKVRSGLRRLDVAQVRDLVGLDPATVNRTRGISPPTRKVVLRLRSEVMQRFADQLAVLPEQVHVEQVPPDQGARDQVHEGAAPEHRSTGEAPSGEAPSGESPNGEPPVGGEPRSDSRPDFHSDFRAGPNVPRLDIDSLALFLIPLPAKRGKVGEMANTVRTIVGLAPLKLPAGAVEPGATRTKTAYDWPTIQQVAASIGTSTGQVWTSLRKAKGHWQSSPPLLSVADDLVAILADLGGVAAVGELTEPLLEGRGSGADTGDASRLAAAVIRAVVECAQSAGGDLPPTGADVTGEAPADSTPAAEAPAGSALPFVTRRFGPRTLVALDGLVTFGDDEARFDGPNLLDLAVTLGERADTLVARGPVVSSGDAVAALRSASGTGAATLADGRLVRLAAAASARSVATAGADLVARDTSAADALRWSRPSLVGIDRLSADDIADRVRRRFPTVELPDRPALDDLVFAAGLPLRWNAEHQVYEKAGNEPGALTTFTRVPARHETVAPIAPSPPLTPQPGTVAPLPIPAQIDTLTQAAIDLELLLTRSLRDGGFLALRVGTDRLAGAQAELARFQNPPNNMVNIDLERRFLVHLRAQAEARNVAWPNVIAADADGPGSGNWSRLAALTAPAVDATVADVLAGGERVIAWFPGALVRHQGTASIGAIDRLRDAVAVRTGGLTTLWLVVLGSTVTSKPTIDGVAVPVIGAEWADVTDGWLRNLHRAEGLTA